MTGMIFTICFRDAISGTTPPNFRCTGICVDMIFDKIVLPPRRTAAAVSSQLDSMANVRQFSSSFKTIPHS